MTKEEKKLAREQTRAERKAKGQTLWGDFKKIHHKR